MQLISHLIVIIRLLFGIGWFLAGWTKIVEKQWFHQPGQFLSNYLTESLQKENVPSFYKLFIEHVALEHVLFFNYTIPIAQMVLGIFLLIGLFTIPSILFCLFMHINFILSGNMNFLSLTLYTSGFILLLFRSHLQVWSFNMKNLYQSSTKSNKFSKEDQATI